MKIRALSIILLLVLLLTACQGSGPNEQKMLEDYIGQYYKDSEVTVDQLEFDSYGTYDGCTVGYVYGPFAYVSAVTKEKVGPFTFVYTSGQKMRVYKSGTWMSMPDAYDHGWLDDAAVEQIREKHKLNDELLYSEYSD